MISITNGSMTLEVTKGAYNSMYASQGWVILGKDAETNAEDDFKSVEADSDISRISQNDEKQENKLEAFEDAIDDEDEDEADLSEIPLSQMTVPQLKRYAQQLGVKANTDSSKELRNKIRKVLSGE